MIVNSDCFDFLKTLKNNSVDLFLLDLPYGQTACEWDVKIDLETMWTEIKRLCKNDKTPVLFFCTTKFGYELIKSNEKWFRYDLVFEKSAALGFLLSKKQPLRAHEMVYVFSKAASHYYPVFSKGKPYVRNCLKNNAAVYKNKMYEGRVVNTGTRYPRSVFKFNNKSRDSSHPTGKSIEICEYLIKMYSKQGDTVCDFTCGQASVGVACILNNRKFIGCEKDIGHYNAARRRLARVRIQKLFKDTLVKLNVIRALRQNNIT